MARSALDVSRIECVACGRLGFGYVLKALGIFDLGQKRVRCLERNGN